jgi:hypothetical protein
MYADLLRNAQANTPQTPVTGAGHQAIVVPLRPLRENHRQINYWTQRDWLSYKSGVQKSQVTPAEDQVGTFDFIESEDGVPVSSERVTAIRRTSRELFASIQLIWEKHGRSVPETWGRMTHSNKDFYRQKMKEEYPELGFCEGDWKCEHLATQIYPGWHRNHATSKSADKVKPEPDANPKQRSKRTVSSKSPTPAPNNVPQQPCPPPAPTPAPDNVSGWTHPPHVSIPAISIPSSELDPSEPHFSLSRDPIVSPVVSALDLELYPDSGIAQGIDRSTVLQVHPGPNPALSPMSFPSALPQSPRPESTTSMDSSSPTPLIPTNMPLDTSPSCNMNQSPNITPLLDVRVQGVASPDTPTMSLQGETTPGGSIQVRL